MWHVVEQAQEVHTVCPKVVCLERAKTVGTLLLPQTDFDSAGSLPRRAERMSHVDLRGLPLVGQCHRETGGSRCADEAIPSLQRLAALNEVPGKFNSILSHLEGHVGLTLARL